MRILHISTRLILGGSQENTVLSCEGQASLGHELHLAFGPIYGPEGSLLQRVENFRTPDGKPITTHVLPDMVRELSPLKDLRAYRQCRALIEKLQPDVVHTHSSKAGILGRLAAWSFAGKHGRPAVIHTIHGLPFHPYQGKTANALYILSERFAAHRCHRIVSVCDAMTRQALVAGVGLPPLFTTVYSGMEIDSFINPAVSRADIRLSLGFSDSDFVIGTVARLAELKGHDDLIDALSHSLRANPHWKLLWVGDGWWRDRLTGRLKDAGIESQVVLTGLVPPEHVGRCIAAMDLLVHPSYREGLPRTLPQALLGACPVIAYDLDGAPEVCLHEQTGLLVPAGDLASLRAAVEWMASHPAERTRMGRTGRDLCRVRFSAYEMVRQLELVYAAALASLSTTNS